MKKQKISPEHEALINSIVKCFTVRPDDGTKETDKYQGIAGEAGASTVTNVQNHQEAYLKFWLDRWGNLECHLGAFVQSI